MKPCKETTVIERIKSVMEKAGVAPGVVDDLVQQVTEPPAGTIDAAVLQAVLANAPQPACEARIALLPAVVAAAHRTHRPVRSCNPSWILSAPNKRPCLPMTMDASGTCEVWWLCGKISTRQRDL